jgi:hypothetical protein
MNERFDLTPQFESLVQDVIALRCLSDICERFGEDVLRSSDLDFTLKEAKAHGYRPILLTKDQYQSFDFLLGHIGDIARRAEEQIEPLERLARQYVKAGGQPCA